MIQQINNALANITYPTRPEGLYEPIAYTLSMGGKRLRPVLLLLSYSLYRSDIERAMPAAIGIETYHNHTLLHDDLMDRADMRRGMPTVHCKWNDNTAVLSGDAMLILAFRHIAKAQSPRIAQAMELFAKTASEVCEGQQYDVNFEQRTDVSEAEYVEMIRLKTSVLLGCAAKMGALLAEAPAADCDVIYKFAERVGLAFQLQDDYLDVYGDPAVFGKKIGGDILCGKKTYLVIATLERCTPEGREEFLKLLNNPLLPDEEKIRRVRATYDALGIPEVCEHTIGTMFEEAHEMLGSLSVSPQPLWEYAESLLKRKK